MHILNTHEIQTVSGTGFVSGVTWIASTARDVVVGLSGCLLGLGVGASILGEFFAIPGAIVGYYVVRGIQESYNASYNANYPPIATTP